MALAEAWAAADGTGFGGDDAAQEDAGGVAGERGGEQHGGGEKWLEYGYHAAQEMAWRDAAQ
jgi:hypothetical protein